MRRFRYAVLLFLVLAFPVAMLGCALTPQEIDAISAAAAAQAGKLAYDQAIKAGLSPAAAEELKAVAAAKAAEIAEKAAGEAQNEKKSKAGAAVMSVIMAGLQLLSGRRLG